MNDRHVLVVFDELSVAWIPTSLLSEEKCQTGETGGEEDPAASGDQKSAEEGKQS